MTLRGSGGTAPLPNDFVYALTGYRPDFPFLRASGSRSRRTSRSSTTPRRWRRACRASTSRASSPPAGTSAGSSSRTAASTPRGSWVTCSRGAATPGGPRPAARAGSRTATDGAMQITGGRVVIRRLLLAGLERSRPAARRRADPFGTAPRVGGRRSTASRCSGSPRPESRDSRPLPTAGTRPAGRSPVFEDDQEARVEKVPRARRGRCRGLPHLEEDSGDGRSGLDAVTGPDLEGVVEPVPLRPPPRRPPRSRGRGARVLHMSARIDGARLRGALRALFEPPSLRVHGGAPTREFPLLRGELEAILASFRRTPCRRSPLHADVIQKSFSDIRDIGTRPRPARRLRSVTSRRSSPAPARARPGTG